jgi:hypothetical protein
MPRPTVSLATIDRTLFALYILHNLTLSVSFILDLANQAMDCRRSWFTMSDDNHRLQHDTSVFL